QEAEIVARAGLPGAVTVAPNMAGRGTDIVLGGNPDIIADQDLRELGFDPVQDPEAYQEAWDEEIIKAREKANQQAEELRERVASTCWARSATSPAASITSCAVVPHVRVTRARPASTSRCATT